MLSTMDLELTNFINPDLTWKVKKGCRSANRRSRKSITGQTDLGNVVIKREQEQDSSVLEYEELGVAVLGRRFAEKVADVPIKKRRCFIKSPSPPARTPSLDHEESLKPQPQTPYPNPEEPEKLKFGGSVDGVQNIKMSEVTKGENEYDYDFSGIQLLAAAACSSSTNDAAFNAKKISMAEEFAKAEGIVDSPSAALPCKESIASSGTCYFSQKDLVNEDDMGDSCVEDGNLTRNENSGIGKNFVSSKDERLHWDLNTLMEAWEEPSDDPLVNSQKIISGCALEDGMMCEKTSLGSCELQRKLEDSGCDMESEVQSVACKTDFSDVEGNKRILDPTSMVIATAKSSLQEEDKECSSPEGTSIEKQYVSTTAHPVSDGSAPVTIMEISTQNEDIEDFGRTSGLPDSRASPRKVISTLTSTVLDSGNSRGGSDKVNSFHPSPKGETLSASSTSAVIVDVNREDDKASTTYNTVNLALQIEPLELMPKSFGHLVSNGVAQEGGVISQESCKSYGDADVPPDCILKLALANVTQDGHLPGVKHVTEYEAGYDSTFEDGELRERGVYSWEENGMEEGETECVDYGSDCEGQDDFDAYDYSVSENLKLGRDGNQISENRISFAKNDDIEKNGVVGNRPATEGGSVRGCSTSLKAKISGRDQLNFEYGIAEGNDGHDVKHILAEEFRLRPSRGRFGACSKGSAPFERKSSLSPHRSSATYSRSRDERDFRFIKSMGRDRFSFKSGGRNEGDDHWNGSYQDNSRNRYPYSDRGCGRYYRDRESIANRGAKSSRFDSHDHDRRSINYSSNGMYNNRPPFMRRRSPVEREDDDSYGSVQRGRIQPGRGMGGDGRGRGRGRGRFRPSYAPGGIRRGLNEDLSDDDASFRRQPYFGRREQRGISPNYSRGRRLSRPPRRDSRSRSRSRSPTLTYNNFQRDRNGTRFQRSPSFRLGYGRREGMRSPFRKPNYVGNNSGEEICMSPPPRGRRRLSPSVQNNNSRWFDGGRRSPGRMFNRQEGQRRFDDSSSVGGYRGRLKSDGFFRPMTRGGGSFSGGWGRGRGRGRNFDEESSDDDERRKHDDDDGSSRRYQMRHRASRFDEGGGAGRRFHYDAQDCSAARHNSHCQTDNDDDDDHTQSGNIQARNDGDDIRREDILQSRNDSGATEGERGNDDQMNAISASSIGQQQQVHEDAAAKEE